MKTEYTVALSDVQLSMIFPHLVHPFNTAYMEQQRYVIYGDLTVDRLRETLHRMVRRNEVLRSIVRWRGIKHPVQVFLCDKDVPLFYEDLSHLPGASEISEREEEAIWRKEMNLETNLIELYIQKIDKDVHYLIIRFHHLMMDGWSNRLFLRQLVSSPMAGTHQSPDQERSQSYYDFLHWRLKHRNVHADYWRSQLQGYRPSGRDAPLQPEYYSTPNHSKIFCMDYALSAALKELARKTEVTVSALYFALWAIVYMSWSNTQDCVLGMVVSGRHNTPMDVGELMGLFMNTLPIRMCIGHGTTCAAMIKNTMNMTIQALAHAHIQLSDILAEQGIRRLSALFVVQNYPAMQDVSNRGSPRVRLLSSRYSPNHPLVVSIREQVENGGVEIEFSYHPHFYSAADIEEFGRRYTRLLMDSNAGYQKNVNDVIDSLYNTTS